ncbi:hypothetical protein BD626DRAFT_549162 [Schizophyllum amplum]|uniref:DUS-like FMN-binding domain-containing protein n=1 Tax=Schizophyllum amplum TaxID=97359 RepID=A0A550C9X4_9AGAR|nr:hypothetical protein BD626DRAFT_549162 [Auriculariopsis ampla]
MDRLTPDDYRNGIFLAPMVRSGARAANRLFALKHGASLVWGPEIVDKAILHAERVVDRASIYQCSPVEKPYLIYQIGTSDPELAVQAARVVMNDPFSTHSGMGAALLSTPDLLCSILRALREAMPPEISSRARFETLVLVGKIIETGISCLTVHYVEFVKASGKDIAVVENGDCKGPGCDSVMIARAAESNPSCFSPTPSLT